MTGFIPNNYLLQFISNYYDNIIGNMRTIIIEIYLPENKLVQTKVQESERL